MNQPDPKLAKRGKTQFLLLALVFFGPLAAAVALYYTGNIRGGQVNYGELLEPALSLDEKLHFDTGTRGRWTLLLVVGGACEETCEKTLIDLRQIRLATGREIERIERMVVSDEPIAAEVIEAHPGLHVIGPGENVALISAIQPLQRERVYIIDPVGNVILSYPTQPERKPFLKDLRKLLKLSRIG
ncbi:MAG: hypothetical protein AAGL69_02025 [Pseudomonadota bacterium]